MIIYIYYLVYVYIYGYLLINKKVFSIFHKSVLLIVCVLHKTYFSILKFKIFCKNFYCMFLML